MAKHRVGRRMAELQMIVSCLPGISRRAAMRAAEMPEAGLGSGRSLNRAITAGLILEDRACPWVRRGAAALFASERDRDLFYLRSELLHGKPTPARAEEIRAEVARLREEQAATWNTQ